MVAQQEVQGPEVTQFRTRLSLAVCFVCRNVRSATAASALGVTAIVIWAVVSLLLFGVAWSNGQVHHMNW